MHIALQLATEVGEVLDHTASILLHRSVGTLGEGHDPVGVLGMGNGAEGVVASQLVEQSHATQEDLDELRPIGGGQLVVVE